jgi:hypothetical protein
MPVTGVFAPAHRAAFCLDAPGLQLNPLSVNALNRAFTNALPSELLKSNRCFRNHGSAITDQQHQRHRTGARH